MFDTIIFDLDNTLYNYDKCHIYALQQTLQLISIDTNIDIPTLEYEYNNINKKIKIELGNTASSHNRFIYFKNLLENLKIINPKINPYINIIKYNAIYWDKFNEHIILNNCILELLNLLKNNKIKIALLTDFQTQEQFIKLTKLGILEYFNIIITSEEIGIEKPNSKGFLTILNRLQILPYQALMIGDNYEKDILGALNCSIPAIFINNTNNTSISINNSNSQIIQFYSTKTLYTWFENIFNHINELEYISKQIGQRNDLVQAGGGNISCKLNNNNDNIDINNDNDNDIADQKQANLLLIKSSGYSLADVQFNNSHSYCLVNNTYLVENINNYNNHDNEINLSDYVMFDNKNKKPSIETYMHTLLNKWVIHLHPIIINKLLISNSGIDIIKYLFPNAFIIPYLTPGIDIYKFIQSLSDNKANFTSITDNNTNFNLFFLVNHGIIISTNNLHSILSSIDYIHNTIINYFEKSKKEELCILDNELIYFHYQNKLCNKIFNICLKITNQHSIIYYCSRILYQHFRKNITEKLLAITCPDQLVYCGIPCIINTIRNNNNENQNYHTDLEHYYNHHKKLPSILIIDNEIFIIASTLKKCIDIEKVLLATLNINNQMKCIYNTLTINEIDYLSNWNAEKWRKTI